MELTREKVLAMEAGREMDRLVGGLVMGLDLVEDTLPYLPKHYYPGYDRTVFTDVPKYSTDISAAWEVVNKISKSVSGVELCVNLVTNAVTTGRITVHSDDSMPLAICKAALLSTLTE